MNTDELLKQREADWGDAVKTYCLISQAWSGLFNRAVQPHQVALAMAQLELIRASINPYNPDSLQAVKAYIQIAQQILERAEKELTRSQHAPQYEQLPLFESLPSPQVV